MNMKTLWSIWSSFVYALVIYGGLGYFLRPQSSNPDGLVFLSTLMLVFGVLVLFQTLFFLFGFPQLASRMQYSTYCLVRWVCAEAIGAYGLVLLLQGASVQMGVVFIGWAFLLEMVLMPTGKDRERYEFFRSQSLR